MKNTLNPKIAVFALALVLLVGVGIARAAEEVTVGTKAGDPCSVTTTWADGTTSTSSGSTYWSSVFGTWGCDLTGKAVSTNSNAAGVATSTTPFSGTNIYKAFASIYPVSAASATR